MLSWWGVPWRRFLAEERHPLLLLVRDSRLQGGVIAAIVFIYPTSFFFTHNLPPLLLLHVAIGLLPYYT